MASRYDVSFYTDLLHKPVVDCDGHPVGALLDLSAGPIHPTLAHPCLEPPVERERGDGDDRRPGQREQEGLLERLADPPQEPDAVGAVKAALAGVSAPTGGG